MDYPGTRLVILSYNKLPCTNHFQPQSQPSKFQAEILSTLPVITWYAIFTIRPKCQQRTTIFAECEVSLYRFLLKHRLYCWSDRPILCGNLIEFDGKKCLYSRSFRFYKHFDVSEKNMGCLAHQKIFLPHFHY